MKIGYKQIENLVMQIAIVLTILSFSPDSSVATVCETLMFVFWGVVVAFKILHKQLRIDNYSMWLVLVYAIWFVCTKLFYKFGLYPSGGLGVAGYIPFCVIFYVLGVNFEKTEEHIVRILDAFFVGETILMITLLPYLEEISESRYAFGAKNQMGQMLGAGVVIGFFILFQKHRNIVLRAIILIFSSMSLMSLMIVGSRTPLIGVVVIAMVSFFAKKDKTGNDYAFVFAIVVAVSIIISTLGGIDYVLELFDLGESSSGVDLNDMTSGRFTLYAMAFRDFFRSPLIGLGAWAYVDNFIINLLRCGGLLLLVLILPISYGKMFFTYKNSNLISKTEDANVLGMATKFMILFYFTVSLMEGFPPLGPNTSVFFLWLLIGITSGKELNTNGNK